MSVFYCCGDIYVFIRVTRVRDTRFQMNIESGEEVINSNPNGDDSQQSDSVRYDSTMESNAKVEPKNVHQSVTNVVDLMSTSTPNRTQRSMERIEKIVEINEEADRLKLGTCHKVE